ncbi:MAG TPA: nuclear transport factor 2 family protein [Bacteroidia bacterium]|nr:nuclear transport factor 2 family protein [Bacteroidia bacterium]
MAKAVEIVQQYYKAFNSRDYAGMLALVDPDVCHEPNQGDLRVGKALLAEFLESNDAHYEETLSDFTYLTEPSDQMVAVDFLVDGIYKLTSPGAPPAHGQDYCLRVNAFLDVAQGKIVRIRTYYNLAYWLHLVSA